MLASVSVKTRKDTPTRRAGSQLMSATILPHQWPVPSSTVRKSWRRFVDHRQREIRKEVQNLFGGSGCPEGVLLASVSHENPQGHPDPSKRFALRPVAEYRVTSTEHGRAMKKLPNLSRPH